MNTTSGRRECCAPVSPTFAIDVLPADGCSPDGVWVEAGFATAGLTREQARELAADYAQDAIFEITATEVLIIATDTGAIVHRGSRRFE